MRRALINSRRLLLDVRRQNRSAGNSIVLVAPGLSLSRAAAAKADARVAHGECVEGLRCGNSNVTMPSLPRRANFPTPRE